MEQEQNPNSQADGEFTPAENRMLDLAEASGMDRDEATRILARAELKLNREPVPDADPLLADIASSPDLTPAHRERNERLLQELGEPLIRSEDEEVLEDGEQEDEFPF